MPLAVYILRNYMMTLPMALIEAARIDGASHFQIFWRLVVPMSVPALASFAIFQFLWTWNDLLVAMVFLGTGDKELVLTGRLVNLLGAGIGGAWIVAGIPVLSAMSSNVLLAGGAASCGRRSGCPGWGQYLHRLRSLWRGTDGTAPGH